jgi:hypothetical protein
MKKARTTQYTIRGVSAELDRALRRKAKERKCSLNRLVIEELTSSSLPPVKPKSDFMQFVGTWEPDPAFDQALEEQRQIDWEMWK